MYLPEYITSTSMNLFVVSDSNSREFTTFESDVCISRPASRVGGRFFSIEAAEPCECGCSSIYPLAYSHVFVEEGEAEENETCHLPVHAVCLELCGQHQRPQLPSGTCLSEDLSMNTLGRLAIEYEELCQDFCGDEIQDDMLGLKADYGVLSSFEWMDEEQMPTSDGFGAFVYHAQCCNKVRLRKLMFGSHLLFFMTHCGHRFST